MFSAERVENWTDNIEDDYDCYSSFEDLRRTVLYHFLEKFGLSEAWCIAESRLAHNWHQHLNNLEQEN